MLDGEAPVSEQETSVPESEVPAYEQAEKQEAVEADATETTEAEPSDEQQKNEQAIDARRERSEKRVASIQQRFGELTGKISTLAEQNERLQRELREAREGRQQQPQQPADADPAPRQQDFTDYESYIDARARWGARQEAKAQVAAAQKQQAEQYQRQQVETESAQVRSRFLERQEAFAKQQPDYFETVMREDVVIPNSAAAMINLMDDGPAVAYYLAKNPAAVTQLANLRPANQFVYLGQISAQLGKGRQVSNAPAPGKPVGSKSAPTGIPEDTEDYFAWREKRMRK